MATFRTCTADTRHHTEIAVGHVLGGTSTLPETVAPTSFTDEAAAHS